MAPRTSRFWCSGSSCECCAARLADLGSPRLTEFCWLRPAAPFPETGGHHSSSRPRRCCAGTVSWYDASAPTARSAGPAGHRSTRRPLELIVRMARENSRWGWMRICGELRTLGIRMGATTIRALLRRRGLGPAPSAPDRAGRSSCEPRPRGCCLRLLHGGDHLVADVVRAVLHPALHQAGRRGRGHGTS